MTVEQYWLVAPIGIVAAMGLMFVGYGVFQRQVDYALSWFDNKPIWVWGLAMIGLAAVMGAIAWLTS